VAWDFVKGILWGGVVAVGGLAAVSQSTLPRGEAPKPVADASVPVDPPALEETVKAPDPVDPAPEAAPADVVAEPPAAIVAAPAEEEEPLLRPMADSGEPAPALVVPDMTAPVASAEVPAADPAPEAAADPAAEPAQAPDADVAVSAAAADTAPADEAKPGESEPSEAATAPAAPEASPTDTPAPEAVATVEPAAEAGAAPVAEPEVTPTEEATPEAEPPANDLPATLALDSGLAENGVAGVKTGRLPSIGAPEADGAAPEASAAPADLPPIAKFARVFENPDNKPLFAILLVDPGTPDVNRADLAALPFAVSFVIDPMAPGAAEAAAIYRAAGQEVVMLATGIPKGAKASDLEQSFAGLTQALPEAVALIDTKEAIFQDDMGLAAEVVTHLADQGRGLVTFDRGLNVADQVARREDLPAATVFRSLDDEGEDAPLIRRYLDRSAFKAAQEGAVVVIGTARPETVTALMEWAVEGRAATVALAPITAVMTKP
jgi:polysaccharide deacetylase 2 family uncharacterized protein YibQ